MSSIDCAIVKHLSDIGLKQNPWELQCDSVYSLRGESNLKLNLVHCDADLRNQHLPKVAFILKDTFNSALWL